MENRQAVVKVSCGSKKRQPSMDVLPNKGRVHSEVSRFQKNTAAQVTTTFDSSSSEDNAVTMIDTRRTLRACEVPERWHWHALPIRSRRARLPKVWLR